MREKWERYPTAMVMGRERVREAQREWGSWNENPRPQNSNPSFNEDGLCIYINVCTLWCFEGLLLRHWFMGLFPKMPRVLNPMCIHGLLRTWNKQAQFGPHKIGKGKNIYLFVYQILDFPKCNYPFFFNKYDSFSTCRVCSIIIIFYYQTKTLIYFMV